MIQNELFLRQLNESNEDYIRRIVQNKDRYTLTWNAIAEICNLELCQQYSTSWYKKYYSNTQQLCKYAHNESGCDSEDILRTIRKERIKLSDERVHRNSQERFEAREETIKEIAANYAKEMTGKNILPACNFSSSSIVKSNKSGILLLSDWHYGLEFENPFNKFNPEICKMRIAILLEQVKYYAALNNVSEIVVLNLSDLIAGRIHSQIRIESRFDVITQTMDVAEILAEFLSELSLNYTVRYGDVLDNHSRLEPNKKESLDIETLVRIIPWYLKLRLSDNHNISFIDNEFGLDIVTCTVRGHDIIGVHGNDDRPATALDKLTLQTHKHYDLLCTAHLHHFNGDEKNESIIVGNGSLMGTDNYAAKLRLRSTPSQTFIVVTENNVIDGIHRIILT